MKSLYTDPDFTGYGEPYLGGQKIMEVYQGIVEAAPPYFQNANLPVLSRHSRRADPADAGRQGQAR